MSPVWIGASMAPRLNVTNLVLTLLFALLIQVGANYANDYFDFIKGADTAQRLGPQRAVQQGWISPQTMWSATLVVFGLALLFALPLMILAGFWSFLVAPLCVALGILYTGGPKPLGYIGLGEVFVFLFFGPIATCGTYYLQTGACTWSVFVASLAPALLSCAILIANNLRDEESDRAAKKMTLVARFGHTFGQCEYIAALLLAISVPFWLVFGFGYSRALLFASVIALPALMPIQKVFRKDLVPVLPQTALLLILYTAVFCMMVNLW
ncbi:MAG: 1,4-dihydroxy-2-naphthoate octaprenyltransferase [Verrucomicrobia bacterium]|nr:1,4-dihydroxy-2-naphthoate octaprenyltransferase [Verrucomicrobiota bacterium]MDE3047601.1 1,4-dihydroxy-2-naphthoate octaprenyltransferase [Verrucomicrobiota bacterium]